MRFRLYGFDYSGPKKCIKPGLGVIKNQKSIFPINPKVLLLVKLCSPILPIFESVRPIMALICVVLRSDWSVR